MIKSEKDYTAIVERIEELLSIPENIENPESKGYVELNLFPIWLQIMKKSITLSNLPPYPKL